MIEDEFLDPCDLCLDALNGHSQRIVSLNRQIRGLCRYHWTISALWVIMDLGEYSANATLKRASKKAIENHFWFQEYKGIAKPLCTDKEIEAVVAKDWTNGKLLLSYLRGEISFPTRAQVREYGRNQY